VVITVRDVIARIVDERAHGEAQLFDVVGQAEIH
jgi:hypothetical protein